MKLILVDPNLELCEAWRRQFGVCPATEDGYGLLTLPTNVEVRCGVFEDVADADALVTAGNSFGIMDGGVDLAVARAFPDIESRIRDLIREKFWGELPVGAAVIAPTIRTPIRDIVYAPTMRVPMSIAGTDAVYRAMWAALTEVGRHNRRCPPEREQFRTPDMAIGTLIVPGLGTGAGRMPPEEAARQMALAWRNFEGPLTVNNWQAASHRHHAIAGRACCG